MKGRHKLLIGQTANPKEDFYPLKRYADIYWLDEMDEKEQERVLPLVDSVYSHGWPSSLDAKKASMLKSLRLFQAGNAGVNAMRFDLLGKGVTFCSNAGGYSEEVAEFAIGLMLAGGKGIVKFDRQVRAGAFSRPRIGEVGRQVKFYRGKTMGVVGYGGIGAATARIARSFGMSVLAFGRHPTGDRGVKLLRGRRGLMKLLRESDVVVLALPLTKATRGIVGKAELAAMKDDATLVNIARGEVVREQEVYDRLVASPKFVYATDVWWSRGGMESYSPALPFLALDNFVGTPHVSGHNAMITGSAAKNVIENLRRYFKGQPLKNVVDRSEYV